MSLDLRQDDPGPVAQFLGGTRLRGERRDDLLRPAGLPGLLRGGRGNQVHHADGAHQLAVSGKVARSRHLTAVSRLQRRLQLRAVDGLGALRGHAGGGPDVGAAVKHELRRVEPRDRQRAGVLGPGPDVLPLAQGLIEVR